MLKKKIYDGANLKAKETRHFYLEYSKEDEDGEESVEKYLYEGFEKEAISEQLLWVFTSKRVFHGLYSWYPKCMLYLINVI